MTRKRRTSEFDAPAQALGFDNVDALIRQRMLDGHRRMDIAAELGCNINVISKRIFAHNPDLASGPDGLDRRHHFVVAKYREGLTVAEIGRMGKIGERRARKILQAEEERTGEKLVRPTAQRNQASRPKSAAASVWNDDGKERTPARDVDADNSGPPLSEQLAKMKPTERERTIQEWREQHQIALDAALFGARLRIAQGVAA